MKKRKFTPEQKASLALSALRGEKVSNLSSLHQIHGNVIKRWRKQLEEDADKIFLDKRKKDNYSKDRIIEELYKIIGQREVEISWLKKNSSLNYREKLALIERNNEISLSRQAKLLDISRSSIYYQPTINSEDIQIMHVIDKIFTKYPFYGHRKIRIELNRNYQIPIGRKKTLSLMKQMGLEPIYPKVRLNLSAANKQHHKFPYLLKNLNIVEPNQVWGTDITYIRLKKGFVYLSAIPDWYSRYVVS